MLPRLEAERQRFDLSIALAAGGRMVSDGDLSGFMQDLSDQAAGERQKRKAPRITLAQAQALGLRPPDEQREEVSE